jgi:hypothetical protein
MKQIVWKDSVAIKFILSTKTEVSAYHFLLVRKNIYFAHLLPSLRKFFSYYIEFNGSDSDIFFSSFNKSSETHDPLKMHLPVGV